MKKFIFELLIFIVLIGGHAYAQETKRVPTFEELEAVAGTHVDSEKFAALLRVFDFSENPKRERSWGSGFGVFLEQSKKGIVVVGIRPASRITNMPTYSGTLPKQLAAEDTAEVIQEKLGKPDRIVEVENAHLVLHYDGFHVITLKGRLFEIWLTEFTEKAEQSNAQKDSKKRFGDRESKAQAK